MEKQQQQQLPDRVFKHNSPSGGFRTSLVLEQYVLPTHLYGLTPDFFVLGQAAPLSQQPDNALLSKLVARGQLPASANLSQALCTRVGATATGRPDWSVAPVNKNFWSVLSCSG